MSRFTSSLASRWQACPSPNVRVSCRVAVRLQPLARRRPPSLGPRLSRHSLGCPLGTRTDRTPTGCREAGRVAPEVASGRCFRPTNQLRRYTWRLDVASLRSGSRRRDTCTQFGQVRDAICLMFGSDVAEAKRRQCFFFPKTFAESQIEHSAMLRRVCDKKHSAMNALPSIWSFSDTLGKAFAECLVAFIECCVDAASLGILVVHVSMIWLLFG